MSEVKLVNVSKKYESGKYAVKGINIEIKDKEFVVLVGPSGCGKSTTLRMIAGLEDITEGEIIIDGEIVNNKEPKDRDIAMVFQNYALYPHMTVFENIAFGLKLRKLPQNEINERVNEAAKILSLEEYLDRKPKALSGGQRQRVAVGRAIVRKPKVFLFDEPLSNLDAKLRVQMRTEISKLHKKLNATIIYVTHDQTEAMTMGEKIVLMKDGVVQQIGQPLSLYNNPVNKFVAGFIGSPSMNFINGKIKKEEELFFVINNACRIKIPPQNAASMQHLIDKEITMGIRPENINYKNEWKENQEISFKVKIDIVEQMGNETIIYFTLTGRQFIARFPACMEFKHGDEIDVYFNPGKLYYFDEGEA